MNCVESKRYLDLFLDGELDVETNLKVLEHLNLCPPCSKVFEGERWLGGEIRSRLSEEKAPAELVGRLQQAIAREGIAASSRRWGSVASLAASFLVAGTVAWAVFFGPDPGSQLHASPVSASTIAEAAARRHDSLRDTVPAEGLCVCPGCTDRPKEELDAWFSKRNASTCHHPMDKLGYRWKNGSMWRDGVRGRAICWTTQATQDRTLVSHASLPATAVSREGGEKRCIGSSEVRLFRVGPRVVIVGGDEGYT